MRTRIASALVLALLVTAALADRENAKFNAARGDKAAAQKKWDEAEGLYRKALEEDETYLPARHGLAQALLGAGKSAPAVEELRAFVESARVAEGAPPEWKTLLAKAEKQLTDLDAAGTALQKIVDGYADELAAIGDRWAAKDPVIAERALRRALKLRASHAKATQVLEKMGKSGAGEAVDLFNGKTLDGWEAANAPQWQVIDGELIGTARDATFFCRTDRRFDGDCDVRVEAKMIEKYAGQDYFGLMSGWRGDYEQYRSGVFAGRFYWMEQVDEATKRDIATISPANLKKPFDLKQWNVYEMRFRGAEASFVVNGEVVGKETAPESRRGGFVGLIVQNCHFAFRKVQVEVR